MTDRHEKALKIIRAIAGQPDPVGAWGVGADDTAHGIVTEVFTQGNCGNFAAALYYAFDGQAAIMRAGKSSDQNHYGHVVVYIDGRMYDITGEVTGQYDRLQAITLDQLLSGRHGDYYDNYSFAERGPIV